MKLKQQSRDFEVEELSQFPADGGPFALYRLSKESMGTLEAVRAICRRWKIDRRRVAFGGLKDRHARTQQFLAILHGPKREFRQENLTLTYIGQASRAFASTDIDANRFRIVIRDVAPERSDRWRAACDLVARSGTPNYFDDQRFGSLGESGEFMALPWCRGEHERALWLAIADGNTHDRPRDREEKRVLREAWGDWPRCLPSIESRQRQAIVRFLTENPSDFRRALALIDVDERSLLVAAFQSYLWNEILADCLRIRHSPAELVSTSLRMSQAPVPSRLTDAQRDEAVGLSIPLPSARVHTMEEPAASSVSATLDRLGIAMRELRIKYPRDTFFSKGERAAWVVPKDLQAFEVDDDRHAGHKKWILRFDLPRAAYATMVIKRIVAIAENAAAPESDPI